MLRAGPAPRILTVTQLASQLREALDRAVGTVWVAGEISNFRRQASGHCYFTLKDKQSQLAAVMFRNVAQVLPFRPSDGMEVVIQARVALYPARGSLQLYVDAMEPRGLGALQLAFEQLKKRLQAEGLFEDARKRPLPRWPRRIGIVTAPKGAAIHDMRTTLRRRWPAAGVVLRPVRVQGAGSAREIAAGIDDLNRLGGVEVIIIGRGGGSLEDLWAFNEEVVARAIVASRVPVVSAVGHQTDFTIADFVADARAATPTAAAALVAPDRGELVRALRATEARLETALVRRVGRARERVTALHRALGDPQRRVRELALRVDDLGARARQALVRRVAWDRRELAGLRERLARSGPAPRVRRAEERLAGVAQRLRFALGVRVRHARGALEQAVAKLDALSPLACLGRGYAIVRKGDAEGPVVRQARALAPGERVSVTFAEGRAGARVEDTEE